MPIGPFRTYSQPVNLRDLEERFDAGADVTPETLKGKRLIRKVSVDVKVLGVGELTKALSVSAHGFSKTARRRSRPPAAASPGSAAARPEEAEDPQGERRSEEPDWATEARGRATRARGGRGRGGEPSPRARGRRHAELARERLEVVLRSAGAVLFRARARALPARLVDPGAGVDAEAIDQYLSRTGGIFDLLNLFSGGALSQFSVFALGIMPYVTASIIVQLMTVVIPRLSGAPEGGRVRLREDQPVHAT